MMNKKGGKKPRKKSICDRWKEKEKKKNLKYKTNGKVKENFLTLFFFLFSLNAMRKTFHRSLLLNIESPFTLQLTSLFHFDSYTWTLFSFLISYAFIFPSFAFVSSHLDGVKGTSWSLFESEKLNKSEKETSKASRKKNETKLMNAFLFAFAFSATSPYFFSLLIFI